MKKMDIMNFNNLCDIADFMYSISAHEHESITVVTFFDNAAELLRCLSRHKDLKLYDIELTNSDINNYTDEYYVSLTEGKEIFVEKARNGETIIYQESDVILYDGDVCSSIVSRNKGTMFEIVICEDGEYSNDLDSDCGLEYAFTWMGKPTSEREYPQYDISYNCEDCDNGKPDWISELENSSCDTLNFALKVIELLIQNK